MRVLNPTAAARHWRQQAWLRGCQAFVAEIGALLLALGLMMRSEGFYRWAFGAGSAMYLVTAVLTGFALWQDRQFVILRRM